MDEGLPDADTDPVGRAAEIARRQEAAVARHAAEAKLQDDGSHKRTKREEEHQGPCSLGQLNGQYFSNIPRYLPKWFSYEVFVPDEFFFCVTNLNNNHFTDDFLVPYHFPACFSNNDSDNFCVWCIWNTCYHKWSTVYLRDHDGISADCLNAGIL
jgi:hypothetical protein